MFCYFLPISNCPKAPVGAKDGLIEARINGKWRSYYYEYLTRRQTWLRKQVYEFTKKQSIEAPCTAMHVRRGDVVLHHGTARRRYHAIAEYMNATLDIHKNIFLMTDDANAITEAKSEFPDHNWMSIDRPRYKADQGGWERQVPSNDPAFEVTNLLSIFRLVKRCDQLIHSRSGFSDQLYMEMTDTGREIKRFNIDADNLLVYNPDFKNTVNVSLAYDDSQKATESK